MRYYVELHEALTDRWRRLDTLPLTMSEAAGLMKSYHRMVEEEGLTLDKGYIVPQNKDLPTHEWDHSRGRWNNLRGRRV